jgi:hypothetical protein
MFVKFVPFLMYYAAPFIFCIYRMKRRVPLYFERLSKIYASLNWINNSNSRMQICDGSRFRRSLEPIRDLNFMANEVKYFQLSRHS